MALFASLAVGTGSAGTFQGQDRRLDADRPIVIARPARRSPEAPPPGPPNLAAGAGRVSPMTLQVVTTQTPRQGPVRETRQTIARTATRIHTRGDDGREWLFEQNPVDPRRVSAHLIDHGQRTIVEHEESDLRNMVGVTGWADVLLLGFDASALDWLQPTGATRTIEGIPFVQLAGTKDGSVVEVWWNREELLPAEFVFRGQTGASRVAVAQARAGVDLQLLESPASRFPKYRVVDLSNWLEGR
jgi:hypothetical protein